MIDIALSSEFSQACARVAKADPVLEPVADDLLKFAAAHERRPIVLHNLARELAGYAKARFAVSKTLEAKQNDRKRVVEAIAHMFMRAIKEKRDRDLWTEAQKSQARNKDSLKNDVAQFIREVPSHGETQGEC